MFSTFPLVTLFKLNKKTLKNQEARIRNKNALWQAVLRDSVPSTDRFVVHYQRTSLPCPDTAGSLHHASAEQATRKFSIKEALAFKSESGTPWKAFSLQNISQLKTDFAHHLQTCSQTHTYPADPKATAPTVKPQQEEWLSQEEHRDRQRCDDQKQPLDVLLLVQKGRKPVKTWRCANNVTGALKLVETK